MRFVRTHDKSAYSVLNDDELLAHIAYCFATNQLRVRVDAAGEPTGLATYGFNHQARLIELFGIVGDKAFVKYMLACWRSYFPFYALTYFRRGNQKFRTTTHNFSHN